MLWSLNHFRIHLLDLLLPAYVCLMLGSPELNMLLTHMQLVLQDLWVLLCRASFQPVDPQPGLMDEVCLPQVQDLVLLNSVWFLLGCPASVALNGSMPVYCVYPSSWFCIIFKPDGMNCPTVQAISEAVKQAWPKNQHLSVPLLTCLQLGLCPAVVKWLIWYKKQGLIFPSSIRKQVLSMRSKHG